MAKVKLKKASSLVGWSEDKIIANVEKWKKEQKTGKRLNAIKSLIPDHVNKEPSKWQFDEDKIAWYLEYSAKRQKQASIPSAEQVDRVVTELIHKKQFRNACQLSLSCYAGLRSVEICRLKIADVADSDGNIKEEAWLAGQRTKTNDKRMLALWHPKLQHPLMLQIKARLKAGADMQDNIIVTRTNTPYNRVNHSNHMTYLYKRHGLTGLSSHSGRRFFITQMVRAGQDLKVAQELAGHKSAVMTAKYYQPTEEQLKNAVLKVGTV